MTRTGRQTWCAIVAVTVGLTTLLLLPGERWHDVRRVAHAAAHHVMASAPSPEPARVALPPARAPRSRSYAVLDALWTSDELAEPVPPLPWPHRGTIARPPEHRVPRTRAPFVPEALRGSIRRVGLDGGRKLVALTFDLCELTDNVTGYDAALVEALRAADAPATFFAGGKWMRSHEEKAMQLLADPRFEIGTHAWTHGNLHELRGRRMEHEILWGITEYETLRGKLARRARKAGVPVADIAAIPRRPALFRFPYGTCSEDALDAVAAAGMVAVQWDVVSGDAHRGAGRDAVTRNVLDRVTPGSIVVFHANRGGHGTARAMPYIVEGLRARGYQLVTVSELLAAGTPESAPECYSETPGDTLGYDAIVGEGFHRVVGWRHPR